MMWAGWKRLAAHAHQMGATLSIEWAWRNQLHRLSETKKFVSKYGMRKHMVAGCKFGLASIVKRTFGHPVCKAWAVWSNNPKLSMALDGPHVRCQGGHGYLAVSGQNTAHSGNYPDAFAKFVHLALATPIDELRKMASSSQWPVVGSHCSHPRRSLGRGDKIHVAR